MTGGRSYLLKEASLTEDNSKKIQLYLYVVESRSEDNFFDSILNLGLYVKTSPADYSVGPWTALENAGSSLAGKYFNGSIPEFSGTYWLISNVTKIVSHDENFGMAATHIPWNWDVNPPFINIDQPSGNKELVLNLKYSKPYRVFFNCSGGSFGFRAVHKYHGCSVTLPYEVPTKEDTNFVGWGLTPDTTEVAYYPEDVYTADESITLYAIWEPKTYTIRFDACGGSVDCYAKSKTHGNSIALPGLTAGTAKPIKLGYNFIGWSTLADGASQDYIKDGDTYSTDKSTTLYAIWEATTYTIQYDANGGTDAPNNQIKEFGQDIKLATSEPNRPGYTFRGWAISPDSPDIYYIPGQSYNINASLNLYAIWKINTYEIKYNANGGINVPETQIKIYDEDITISSVIPVRPEYRFEGWTITSTNTEVYYKAGDVYSNNESVTLYAIWTPGIAYDIKYYDYSDTAEYLVQEKLHGVALALSNSKPSRDGCIFEGWACDSESTEVLYRPGDIYTEDKSLTLYPVRFKKIILCYYGNGGSEGPSDQTAFISFNDATTTAKQLEAFSVSFEISELIPKRAGYTFKNWITSTGKTYKAKDSIECSKDTALLAQWTPIPYTLTIDPNGGHRATKDTETFTISTQCGEIYYLEPLQREGYRLVGFTLEPDAAEIVFDNASQTFIYTQGVCDVTATAQWEINTYDVVFDANGGTGAPEPQVKIHGETLHLSRIIPVKENYVFSGWSPSLSYTAVRYCDSDPGMGTRLYYADESVTLYAIWEPKTYYINCYGPSSTCLVSYKKVHGQDIILSLNSAIPGRENYIFLGWSTEKASDLASVEQPIIYMPNEAYTIDADISLFSVVGYEITVNLNNGTGITSYIRQHGKFLELEKPVQNGYTFEGWRDNLGKKYPAEAFRQRIYTRTYLTALWAPDKTAVKCYIQLDPNGGTWGGVTLDTTHLIDETINGVRQIKQKVYYHKGLDIYSDIITPYRPISSSKTFVGWNTKADGSGCWYGAKLSHDIIASTTLFAQWASSSSLCTALPTPFITSVTQVENTNTIEVNCAARYNGTINRLYAIAFKVYATNPGPVTVIETLIASGIVYKVFPSDNYSFQIHLGDNLADYIKSLFSFEGGSLGFKYKVTLESLGTAGPRYNSSTTTYGSSVNLRPSFVYYRKPESPFNIKITDFDLSKSSSNRPLTLSYMPSTLRLSEVNYDFVKAYENEHTFQGTCYIQVADVTDGSVILKDPIKVNDSGAYFNLEECLDSAGKSFEFGHVYSFTAENRISYRAYIGSTSNGTEVSRPVELFSDPVILGYIKLEEKIPFDKIRPTITSTNTLPTTNLFDGERTFFSTSKRAEGPNYDIKISWPEAASANNKLESYELLLLLITTDDECIGEYRINLQENEYYLDIAKVFGELPVGMYSLLAQMNVISAYGEAYSAYSADYDLVYLIHGINCPYIEIPGEPVKRRAVAYIKVPDPENSETTRWMLASDYLIKEKNQGWKPGYSDYEMLVDENNEIILDEDGIPIYTF